MEGEIYQITCQCGLKFSSEKYYKQHLRDVKEAIRLVKTKHGQKEVLRLEK